ncbi:MAG: hypothetical protein DDT23_00964 [candidate division WS2 bacterium]|nr:hypothetical protein [Candidatus Lithacetigena glycinireducens]
MENFQDKGTGLENEPEQEDELLKEAPSDEVKLSVIEKYGLNEEIDEELINKLVEGELESRKKLSTAIKQKRSWREKAESHIEKNTEGKSQPPIQSQVFDEKVLDQKLNEKLEERELQSLDVSDELKQEVKTYAKASGLNIKQVLKSDYFKFLKQEEEKKQKVDEAAIGGKHRAPSRQEYSAENPPEADMSVKEGREEWDRYVQWLKSQK